MVNCPVELPVKLPVPDIQNCSASARSKSSHLLPVPHVFLSVLISKALVTVLQTVSQKTLDTCSCSEALRYIYQSMFCVDALVYQ